MSFSKPIYSFCEAWATLALVNALATCTFPQIQSGFAIPSLRFFIVLVYHLCRPRVLSSFKTIVSFNILAYFELFRYNVFRRKLKWVIGRLKNYERKKQSFIFYGSRLAWYIRFVDGVGSFC